MIPTMTYFKVALSAPAHHFKRLRSAEPLLCNGSPITRRTNSAIESEILWEGRRFLLYLPLQTESIHKIEELESIARERSRGPLLENHILYEELTMFDSVGHKHLFDIVLQELPSGKTLREAVNCYRANDLKAAIVKMKSRLDAIGFRHNNLKPENILICDSGIARPLRYWYAEWELYSDNDISPLLDFIEQSFHPELDAALSPLPTQEKAMDGNAQPSKDGGVKLHYKGRHYGFVDGDGRQITPFIYSWASDFEEGRAIVAKNGKMGAIDCNGHKVIPVIYNSLEFNIETGFFTATRTPYCYLIDYDGKIVRRTRIEENEHAMAVVAHF